MDAGTEDDGVGTHADAEGIPLLEGRQKLNNRATVFVCENYVCQLPVNDAESLAAQLAS